MLRPYIQCFFPPEFNLVTGYINASSISVGISSLNRWKNDAGVSGNQFTRVPDNYESASLTAG